MLTALAGSCGIRLSRFEHVHSKLASSSPYRQPPSAAPSAIKFMLTDSTFAPGPDSLRMSMTPLQRLPPQKAASGWCFVCQGSAMNV